MNYDELSTLLKVKKGTLYHWVYRKKIPFIRLSERVVRFRLSEITAWLNDRSINPTIKENDHETMSFL